MRIDKLLVERGLVKTRERARALIMAGDVLVEDAPVTKAGTGVDDGAHIRLRRPTHPFVGRGGVKLQGAVDVLGIDPAEKVCADIGSSTGGFTDCLLQRGALRVWAVDVDTSQLDWKLRSDPRVTPVEGNARYLSPDWIPEPLDLVTVDVAFISVTKILGRLPALLKTAGQCLILVKPQFELGPDKVGKGGIVLDPSLHLEAVEGVLKAAAKLELVLLGRCPSPITGKEGNREFFLLFGKP
jgi:23S rRNA (cytidine1920-2'-O)/16S rRNA (cytidine1409-2'-O)-methyltransferase